MPDDKHEIIAYRLAEKSSLPQITPAKRVRDWQLATAHSYATRCLPLNIANNNGWELALPGGFDAVYHGGDTTQAIEIYPHNDGPCLASSHFGYGVLTFFLHYLFRTSEGVNIQIQGPVNEPRDGIQALSGILETDWSPYSSTMNWKFTRPCRVRFRKGDCFAQISPIPARYVNSFSARIGDLEQERPDVYKDLLAWSESRRDFLINMRKADPETLRTGWQKLYYRGYFPDGERKHCEHAMRLNPSAFAEPEQETGLEEISTDDSKLAEITCLVRVSKVDWRLFRTLDELSGRVKQIIVFFQADKITSDTISSQMSYRNVDLVAVDAETDSEALIARSARFETLIMLETKHMLLDEFWEKLPLYQQLLEQKYDRILLNLYRCKYAYPSRARIENDLNTPNTLLEPLYKNIQVMMNSSSLRSESQPTDFIGNDKVIIT